MRLKSPPRAPPSSSSRRGIVPLVAMFIFVTIHYTRQRHATVSRRSNSSSLLLRSAATAKDERVPTYELPSTYTSEPRHLTPINPSTLKPKGSHPIDVAHRNGLLHTGHVLFVMDSTGKILFLQRSSSVITCPNTWSILGEHSTAGETERESVVRGIEEELGFVALTFEESSQFNGAWTADFHPVHNMKTEYHVTIQNITEFPLYYIRHYGPRNDNRVDRQLTYLWLVQFPKEHTEIEWTLDDEVANHEWVNVDEVGSWLSSDAAANNAVWKKTANENARGVEEDDDGPDEGDFCHGTIRSLYEVGLLNML